MTTGRISPPVIGLIGYKQSGKSTVADILAREHSYQRIAFADPLKLMLKALGLTEAQLWGDLKEVPAIQLGGITPRHAMQTLGTEWGRQMIHPDIWTRAWQSMVINGIGTRGSSFRVVAEDMRFPNEAAVAKDFQGAEIWHIDRPGHEPQDPHPSEQEWKKIVPTRVVVNDQDLEWLATRVAAVMR